jgi:hypothetical protein
MSKKQVTDIGFKRIINKDLPMTKGMRRKYVKCCKCKNRAYYDYVPYSLSNPIMWASCGHSLKDEYKEF